MGVDTRQCVGPGVGGVAEHDGRIRRLGGVAAGSVVSAPAWDCWPGRGGAGSKASYGLNAAWFTFVPHHAFSGTRSGAIRGGAVAGAGVVPEQPGSQ